MTIQEAKSQIVSYSKRLYESKMVSVYEGNVSIRLDDRFIITPTHTDKAILTEDMLVEIDRDGNVLNPECGKKVSSEWRMHIKAYDIRPDANAIIHCHSPYATAYAMAGKPIEPKGLTEAICVFHEIPLAPYGRPSTENIADGFGKVLPDHDVVLLESHGVLTVSDNLTEAYALTEAAEKVAHMELLAHLLGGEKPLPPEEIAYVLSL